MKRAVSKQAAGASTGRMSNETPNVEDYDDLRELEESLRIDEYALEAALREQPELFYRVASAYAMEISRRDAAKQALQDAESEADLGVRRDAQQEERKITEGEIRAMVQIDASVVKARARLNRLSESVGRLGSLKEAFQQRSYALKDLAGLYVANYYSASENNAASGAVRNQSAEAARRAMNEARRGGARE